MTASAPAGRVYDRGYRPYDGPLGGRRAAVAALWRSTMRRALGIRRPWRMKVFPWLLLAMATVPAVVNVGIAYVTRDTPAEDFEIITYHEYVGVSTMLLVFVGLVAPDAVCPDRRNRFLPLLFSRPLTGSDYVLAKVGAIATIVFAFGFLPQVVLFVGNTLVSDAALDYVGDNLDVLWQVPVSVAVLALYYASFAVAIAASTSRRLVGAAVLLVVLLVTSIVADVLTPDFETSLWPVANLLSLPLYVRDIVFFGEIDMPWQLKFADGAVGWSLAAYVAVVGGSLGVLLRRYRWVET